MDGLIILGLLVVAAGAALLAVRSYKPRRPFRPYQAWPRRGDESNATSAPRSHDPADPSDQLRAVMAAQFTARKVMRLGEYRVFRLVEKLVQNHRGGFRVFAQTSLGEIIESKDRIAHSAINSKRVDMLVIGPNGLPMVAIEYQGNGHHQSEAAARDAVKKEALRKAGVQYLEIMEFHRDEDVTRLVREALERATGLAFSAPPPTRAPVPAPAPAPTPPPANRVAADADSPASWARAIGIAER